MYYFSLSSAVDLTPKQVLALQKQDSLMSTGE